MLAHRADFEALDLHNGAITVLVVYVHVSGDALALAVNEMCVERQRHFDARGILARIRVDGDAADDRGKM